LRSWLAPVPDLGGRTCLATSCRRVLLSARVTHRPTTEPYPAHKLASLRSLMPVTLRPRLVSSTAAQLLPELIAC
jgi:hypothetical protein